MNNSNHTAAKILTLIPIIVFLGTSLFLGFLAMDYFSTGSEVTAIALIFTGTMSLIFTTLPCLIMSVLGTIFASKAKKEGITKSHKFFVIGIIEIIVYGAGVMGGIAAILFTIIAIT